jgi:hypothetical protein
MLVTGAEQVKNKSKICKNRGHIHGPTCVALEAKFSQTNYISEFLSQFHPISKKKSAETEFGK